MSIFEARFELGIADTVRAVDAIFDRRQKRQEVILQDVADDMEALTLIIRQMMDEALRLFAGYADLRRLSHPIDLTKLIQATEEYLYGRQLLPKLQTIHGRVRGYLGNNTLAQRRYRGIVVHLDELHRLLDEYMDKINANRANSGTEFGMLTHLYSSAQSLQSSDVVLDDETEEEHRLSESRGDVMARASQALERMDLKLPGDILTKAGIVQGILLGAAN